MVHMHSESPARHWRKKSVSACATHLRQHNRGDLGLGLGSLSPMVVDDGAREAPGSIPWHWVNVQFQQVLRTFL
jgi:hypothetical protein